MAVKSVEPPNNLSPEAQAWWRKLTKGRVMEQNSLLILQSAMECFDRMREAQPMLKRDGRQVLQIEVFVGRH